MPVAGGHKDNGYSYGRTRAAAGLILVSAVVLLLLIDSVSEAYSVDNVTIGLMLGTAGVLLGVEAIRKVVG